MAVEAQNVKADIEVCAMKIEQQQMDLKQLQHDSEDLQALKDVEKENQEKLITLAKDKYKMDLSRIGDYIPKKSMGTLEKKKMELKLVAEAKAEKIRLRQEAATVNGLHKEQAQLLKERKEKVELLKLRLRRKL